MSRRDSPWNISITVIFERTFRFVCFRNSDVLWGYWSYNWSHRMTKNIVHKSKWNNFDDIFSIQFSNENQQQVHSTRKDRIIEIECFVFLIPHLLHEMIVSLLFLLLKIERTWMIGFDHFDPKDETKNKELCSIELFGKCSGKEKEFFFFVCGISSSRNFRKIFFFAFVVLLVRSNEQSNVVDLSSSFKEENFRSCLLLYENGNR